MDGSMSFIWFAFYGESKYIKFGTDSRDYLIYFINYVATLQDGKGAVLAPGICKKLHPKSDFE